jgi:hypothetical protein
VRTPLTPAPHEKLLFPPVDDGKKKDSDRPLRELSGIVFPASAKDVAASILLDSKSGDAGGKPKNAAESFPASLRLLPPTPRTCAGKLSLRFRLYELLHLCPSSMPTGMLVSSPDVSFSVVSFSSRTISDLPTNPTLAGSVLDVLTELSKTAAAPEQPYATLAGVPHAESASFNADKLPVLFRGDDGRCW